MERTTTGAATAAAGQESCAYPLVETLIAAQQQFDALVRTALKPCERWICRDREFEDRRQEGLGRTWAWYSAEIARGRVPDTALVVHACRLAMVSRGRTVVGHEHRPHYDVYDRQGLDIELRRLDGVHDHDDDDNIERGEPVPSLGLARMGVADPSTNIVSAMDLTDWLDTLASTDREMMELRGAGYALEEISRTTGRSVAGVFRRARQLGTQLADRAGVALDT